MAKRVIKRGRKNYTIAQKRSILNNIIKKRAESVKSLTELTKENGITMKTMYSWMKEEKLKSFREKLDEAIMGGRIKDNQTTHFLAKQSLNELLSFRKEKRIIKNYKYITDDDGNKVKDLVSEREEIFEVSPDKDMIKFALQRLDTVYNDNNQLEIMVKTFLDFGEWLKDSDSQLAKQFTILQNNFMSLKAKEIEYKEVRNEKK